MQQKTLTRLVTATSDMDYVEHFQALADVNVQMHKDGPTVDMLVRKSILEADLGNFSAARKAAYDALNLDPESSEAQYQLGLSSVMLAFVKAGAVPAGPGQTVPPAETIQTLLANATRAFGEAVRLQPDDEEAKEDLVAVSRLLSDHPSAEDMVAMLHP